MPYCTQLTFSLLNQLEKTLLRQEFGREQREGCRHGEAPTMVVRGLVKKAMPLARSGELIENYFLVGEALLARR